MGVVLESDHAGAGIRTLRVFYKPADQVSMTPVNAVEHAYGDSRVAVDGEMGEGFI